MSIDLGSGRCFMLLNKKLIKCHFLTVHYLVSSVPPQIIDKETSTDLVVKEGSNVTLHCKAKGHPEPYVMWRREDNTEIQYNGVMGKADLPDFSKVFTTPR